MVFGTDHRDSERLVQLIGAHRKERNEEHIARVRAMLALRRNDPDMLARLIVRARVMRGVTWLFDNARSPGWWRNCLNPGRGSRIRMRYSEESVLALTFEYESQFADRFGYVHDWMVFPHFFGEYGWTRPATRRGFYNRWKSDPAPRRHPEVKITDEMLDREWAAFVEDPPGDWMIQYRHPISSGLPHRTRRKFWLW